MVGRRSLSPSQWGAPLLHSLKIQQHRGCATPHTPSSLTRSLASPLWLCVAYNPPSEPGLTIKCVDGKQEAGTYKAGSSASSKPHRNQFCDRWSLPNFSGDPSHLSTYSDLKELLPGTRVHTCNPVFPTLSRGRNRRNPTSFEVSRPTEWVPD